MKTRKYLALLLSFVMVLSLCGGAFAAPHLTDEVTELETKNSDISESLAEEGYVLLENNGVLPLDKGGKEIALYGNAIAYTVKGGTGSGAVNNRANDNIAEAFEAAGWTVANPNYVLDVRVQKDNEGNPRYNEDGTPVYRTGVTSDVEITDEALAEGKSTDTAIFAIARNAGEGSDRTLGQYSLVTQVQRDPETNEIIADAYTSYTENLSTNAYSLTDIERANIEKVAAAYENVIVVLNTPVIDTKWLHEVPNIDGVIYMHNGGQRGSEALVNIITGKATPSGKLTDTFALNYEDYPEAAQSFSYLDGNENNEWYTDGIYVGYRYFDTFGKEVSYPFGYGLSYTDFDITVDDVTVDADYVTVTATVANIGDKYAGKEVVEVYFSAPQGKLDKPYQELAAYGKTDLLKPGQQQTLTVNFATKDLSSYSEELAAYVIEAGDYIIRVGNGSRSTHVAAVLTASEDMITEQLANKLELEDGAVLDEIDSFDATPITYDGEAEEIAAAERIAIPAIEAAPLPAYNDGNAHVYLFAADAENYVARTGITLRSKASAQPYTINNAQYPNGDGPSNGYGPTYYGYSEYVYDEVVEIVPDLPDGITKETAKLTDVYEGRITMDQFLACLSSDECARLAVGGAGTMEPAYAEDGNEIGGSSTYAQGGAGQTTQAYYLTRHIPVLPNADGPAGVRITQHYWLDVDTGARYTSIYYNDEGQTCTRTGNNREGYTYVPVNVIDQYQFCTAFPAGNCMAMTWDVDLIYAEGVAVGSEMYEYGVTTWLAPGINIHRNPLCGRNFEYYSEDPLVTGLTAAHVTAGVQSNPGVGVTIKHFYGNSQEFRRSYCNNIISERASREIYLKGFEICVRLAQPQCIMNSYNANNGWFSSDNRELNEDITRDEWGFKGAIMTDWGGGQSDPPISMYAGCDLIMSGGDSRMNQVRNAVGAPKEPTFNEDGSIAEQGDFVFDPNQEEPPTYTIETNLESVDAAPESVKRAEQAGYASIFLRGGKVVVGWYGSINEIGKISYGDVQKSARRMLNLCLQSKDMVALYADLLDKTVDDPVPYSEANDAPLATGYKVVEKGDVTDIPGIKAGTVEVDTAESLTVDVPFTYDGDVELTTARFTITSDVPFATETVDGEVVGIFTSDNDVEFNPATKEIIVYKGDGEAISGDLFTLTFDASDVEESGEYPVVIELIEATDANGDIITVKTFDGCIKVTVAPVIGDVNQDGQVDNRDLIMIARYLVHLVDFTEDQKALADINGDEIVNNTDLVLLARSIVGA